MNMNEKLDLLLKNLRTLSHQERDELVKEYEKFRVDHLTSQYIGYEGTLEVDIEHLKIEYNRIQQFADSENLNNEITGNESFSFFKPNYSEAESNLNFAA